MKRLSYFSSAVILKQEVHCHGYNQCFRAELADCNVFMQLERLVCSHKRKSVGSGGSVRHLGACLWSYSGDLMREARVSQFAYKVIHSFGPFIRRLLQSEVTYTMTAWVRTPVRLWEGRVCVEHLHGWKFGDHSRHWSLTTRVKKHFFQTSREEFPMMSSPAMDDAGGA